jgi:hypothetical protein
MTGIQLELLITLLKSGREKPRISLKMLVDPQACC